MTRVDRSKQISVDKARLLASSDPELAQLAIAQGSSPLEELFFEADNCWMFFRNRSLVLPYSIGFDAYAVSKRGNVRRIADFFDDPQKAQDYLQVMSKHFADNDL
jgi:hypothetical protein